MRPQEQQYLYNDPRGYGCWDEDPSHFNSQRQADWTPHGKGVKRMSYDNMSGQGWQNGYEREQNGQYGDQWHAREEYGLGFDNGGEQQAQDLQQGMGQSLHPGGNNLGNGGNNYGTRGSFNRGGNENFVNPAAVINHQRNNGSQMGNVHVMSQVQMNGGLGMPSQTGQMSLNQHQQLMLAMQGVGQQGTLHGQPMLKGGQMMAPAAMMAPQVLAQMAMQGGMQGNIQDGNMQRNIMPLQSMTNRQYDGMDGGVYNLNQGHGENRLSFDTIFMEGLVPKDILKEMYRQFITFQRPFTVALDACGLDPVLHKVIKSAGKKRLTDALEKYAPKPKDLKAEGKKAFDELSSKQRYLLQRHLATKQFKDAVSTVGLKTKVAQLFVQLGRDFLRTQFKDVLGVELELFVKKRKNHDEEEEDDDSDVEVEGSAKKKKRLSLETPEVTCEQIQARILQDEEVGEAELPSGGYSARGAANPFPQRPKSTRDTGILSLYGYGYLSRMDPVFAAAPDECREEMRLLATSLSYMHDGLAELKGALEAAALPAAARQCLLRTQNTLEYVNMLQERRYGILEQKAKLEGKPAATKELVMECILRTIYKSRSKVDGRTLAENLATKILAEQRRLADEQREEQMHAHAVEQELAADEGPSSGELHLPDQDEFTALLNEDILATGMLGASPRTPVGARSTTMV